MKIFLFNFIIIVLEGLIEIKLQYQVILSTTVNNFFTNKDNLQM